MRLSIVQAAADAAASSGRKGTAALALPKRPPANPLMLGLPADAYVLRSVSSVRANDLEQALLLLPFNDALRLLQWVSGWLAQGAQVGVHCCLTWQQTAQQGQQSVLCFLFSVRL